jgi:CheY-like chemotaxis protein
MTTKSEPGMNDLRIPYHEAMTILAELDSRITACEDISRRQHTRIAYRVPDGLQADFIQPDRSTRSYRVIPHDMSPGGIGFLHGGFIYPGTVCEIVLVTVDAERVRVRGSVARCDHIRATIHEVGVAFDQTVDLANYIRTSDEPRKARTAEDLPSFPARVLYVEQSVDDRELCRFLLSRLGATGEMASDASEALAMAAANRFDLVLISMDLEGRTGYRIAELLSDSFCTGPFIACTADESPQSRVDAMANGFSAVLTKPYELESMIDLLTHCVKGDREVEKEPDPIYSTKWADEPMRPVILGFLQRLEEKVQRLEQFMAAKDAPALGKLCSELKASAGGYGYEQIGATAREIEKTIAERPRSELLQAKSRELVALCKGACRVRRDPTASANATPRPAATK